MYSWSDIEKGLNNLNKIQDLYEEFHDSLYSHYRDAVDWYNDKVRTVQRYFQDEPMEDEDDFDVYNLLDTLGIPRDDKDDLLRYMERYGLTWSDLRTTKVLRAFGSQQSRAYHLGLNFVSKNINKLYR